MPRFRYDNPWQALWQIATSDYLLAAVLLGLAIAFLFAAWLPQTSPDGLDYDVAWQAALQRSFGGVAWFDTLRSPLQAIGAFYVVDALGFRLLLALLALSLLSRLVDSVERLWQEWTGDSAERELRSAMLGSVLPDKVASKVDGSEGEDCGESAETLRRTRWRFWSELGSVGIYLGAVVVLAGVAMTDLWSWQMGPLPLAAGESVPLGHGSELTLRLESLDRDGRRGVGEIWRGGNTLVGVGELTVGQPLRGEGIGAFLVGRGPGLRVQATLSDTSALELVIGLDTVTRGDLVLTFTEDEPRHLVGVPEADLVLLLTMTEPGQMSGRPRVQVFEDGSGQFILEQEAIEDTALTVGDVSLAMMPVPYAEFQVVHDSGAFWSQLGVIGLIAGAIVRGLLSPAGPFFRRRSDFGFSSGGDGIVDDVDAEPHLEASAKRSNQSSGGVV